ncbi:uncharacterized protein G2W53_006372 [Senna tora]|uniref:Uncharacterized protein n=1 Tax=Senna tora TaxID=362788 RepID=A0A834X4P0_9FABA|nr:uncharacterized protein G2W53_006372 [Senna tora]
MRAFGRFRELLDMEEGFEDLRMEVAYVQYSPLFMEPSDIYIRITIYPPYTIVTPQPGFFNYNNNGLFPPTTTIPMPNETVGNFASRAHGPARANPSPAIPTGMNNNNYTGVANASATQLTAVQEMIYGREGEDSSNDETVPFIDQLDQPIKKINELDEGFADGDDGQKMDVALKL